MLFLKQIKFYLKAARAYQWVKNLLLFIPAITANIYEQHTFVQVSIAFMAFCCIASSVYIINDIIDLKSDRMHPVKKYRPFASGVIKISHGLIFFAVLFLTANIVSLVFLPINFFAMIIIYFVLALIYSFKLKSKLIIDICTLSTLYTIRIIAGGFVAGVACSPWLLAFSGYIFLSLAAIKRHTELINNLSTGCAKALGTAYTAENINLVNVIAIASGYISVLVLALYINNRLINLNIHNSYKYGSVLWAACPIIIYWLTRLVFISQSGKMNYDPLVYTLHDKVSLICMVCIIIIFIISSF